MWGYVVLYLMGWDVFGLFVENVVIECNVDFGEWIDCNID